MKFRIFGWHELTYKWIALLVMVALTFGSLKYHASHPTDDFVISIIYALFLFIVGIYTANMSSTVQNLFYRRREQYLNMKSLKLALSLEKLESLSDDSVKSFIITHQVFTARSWTPTEQTPRPIVRTEGFTYKKAYIELETDILNELRKFAQDIELGVRQHIECNRLKQKVRYINVSEMDKISRDVDAWIDAHLELDEQQTNDFKRFINLFVMTREKEIRRYEKKKEKFRKLNLKYVDKVNKIIQRIERTYGDRLKFELEEKHDLKYRLNVLEELITNVKENLLDDDDIERIVGDKLDDISSNLEAINSEISHLREDVEDSIL
ncbi:hypothetical protein [Alicyclobacillus mengziensis]|uniref:Uncharacterized protein n=1 Tax=Alicyclobacillus mengziensis TaxID=2931921 RepID=A0A9X7W0G4_9BACL|nr:hypothetical protein [Alicyclobacillus mengziensis]QSO48354.1 hypothetical protein JZ786_05030 [Alicyclobacillus mengziensis]